MEAISNPCENNEKGISDHEDVWEQKKETIRQLSYLGKVDENDVTDSSIRKFFASQFYKDYNRTMTLKRYWAERRANVSPNSSIDSI